MASLRSGRSRDSDQVVTDSNYGTMLDQYMVDIKKNQRMEAEMRKMEMLEKLTKCGILDFVFPWHMQLGRLEKTKRVSLGQDEEDDGQEQADGDEFAYTPFKVFNRRHNFLLWMHSRKFDHLYSPDEMALMQKLE